MSLVTVLLRSDTTTGAALARPMSVGVRVRRVVGMVVRAVRDQDRPASKILSLRDWFKMKRIDAKRHTAEMVQNKSLGDGANEELIREPMREPRAIVNSTTRSELAIPGGPDSAVPYPAIATLVDLLPEPLGIRAGFGSTTHLAIVGHWEADEIRNQELYGIAS